MFAEWDCIFRQVGTGRDSRVKPGYDEAPEYPAAARFRGRPETLPQVPQLQVE
jgi:hypothetical protein